jgi:acyl-CoA thioesterase-1
MPFLLRLLLGLSLLFASSLAAQPAAQTPAPKTILVLGDSLSAGYGLEDPAAQSFPGLLQAKINAAGLPYRVVNAGLSGDTSSGGLRRIDWVLRTPVDIFILELGGNDGLRGLDPALITRNLQGILDKVRAKNPDARLVVAGMRMPDSMGSDYTSAFAAIFPALASANDATLIPFLLEGVGGVPSMNLADGFHPNIEGHRKVAEIVWARIVNLL